ncbi:SNF2-related protein [Gordonia sp. CPCC 205333]|uniref:DEAD/DEAH box helicase n=1 Tax=Gordonia sp. CPCC 205333 TaxID=3140790 RepID=UPI003AF37532
MPSASGYTVNDLLRSFTAGAVERGTEYARQRRISDPQWSPDSRRLVAQCRGSGGHRYRTIVDFALQTTPPTVVNSRCTCPVGGDCKHAVALIIAEGAKVIGSDDGAMWRQYLAEIETDDEIVDSTVSVLPLGLMFTKRIIRDAVSIVEFRPVTLGSRGKWLKTKATWRSLSTSQASGQYDPAQVSALREIVRSLTGTTGYFNRDTLTLTSAPPDFWRALSDAVEVGVVLAGEGFDTSTVALANDLSMSLEIIRDDAGFQLVPGVILNDRTVDASRLMVIGRPRASGAFISDDSTLWIGPFGSPLTATETSLFANRQSISIPEDDTAEFAEALPTLIRHRQVHVPDDIFQPPVVLGPTPLLAITADEHGASLSWHIWYEIDGRTTIFDAGTSARDSNIRDGETEAAGWLQVRSHIEAVASVCATWRHQAIDFVHTHPGLMRATEVFSTLSAVTTAPSLEAALALAPPHMLRAPLRIGTAESAVLRNEIVPKIETDDALRVEWRGIDVDYRLPQTPPQISFGVDDKGSAEHDWLDLAITLNVDAHVLPISEVIAQLAGGATHMVLDDGTYFSLDAPELRRLGDLLSEARAMGEFDREKVSTRTLNVTLWDELLDLGVVDQQILTWQSRLKQLAAAKPPAPVAPPTGLDVQLRHYQQQGLDWLSFLWDNQLGGILADDMGLGKTIQTLALISRAVAADPAARFLVVAPTSVIANWAAEVHRFTSALGVCEVVSTQARAGQSLADQIGDANIVVTSYTLLRIDFDAFDSVDWAGAIFDEAQFIKNHNGKTHKSARALSAPFKLAITGTPMENNLMELWSLLSVSAPGLFRSPAAFREHFAKPIEAGEAPEQLEILRRRIRPLMLRRTKTEVVTDLPPKQEQVLSLTLGANHRKLYDTHLARERQKLLGLLDDWEQNQFMILRALTRLRQLSLHPGLVDPDLLNVSAAKVEYLAEQIPELLAEGHSSLIFSTFTGFLRLLRETFDAAGIAYAYLDGSMSAQQRKTAIDDFTAGRVAVFLISLKAGGFGLNLTQADYCFVCDPWWNPAAEAQAVDRAHRIGQLRPVNVYRLVSAGTIEEKVVELQDRKRELFTAVVDEGNAFSAGITADDVRGLLD